MFWGTLGVMGELGLPAPLFPHCCPSSRPGWLGSPGETLELSQDPAWSGTGHPDVGWMLHLQEQEDGKLAPSAQAEPAPAPSHPWSLQTRSPRGRLCWRLPGMGQILLPLTPTALPLPFTIPHANTTEQTTAPALSPTPAPYHGVQGWGHGCSGHSPHPPGTSTLQTRHPPPHCSPRRVPLGGSDGGGSRSPAALPHQAPPRLQLPHYYSAQSLPEQPARLWWEEAGGHSAANGAGIAEDPHAAPRCHPHRTSWMGRVPCPKPLHGSAKPPGQILIRRRRPSPALRDAHGTHASPMHGPRGIAPPPTTLPLCHHRHRAAGSCVSLEQHPKGTEVPGRSRWELAAHSCSQALLGAAQCGHGAPWLLAWR